MTSKILEELENNVKNILPDEARRKKGPYALFECFQSIPCNPCYTACKFNAVKPLTTITDLPETYFEHCVGCGACITACPGLAAFVIDETYSQEESLVKIPYEFLPLPEVGTEVDGVNRIGEVVCKVRIESAKTMKNKTAVVAIAVPKDMTHVVRGIQLTAQDVLITPVTQEVEMGESIVCRCEDVSLEEIKASIDEGADSLKQVKLNTRISMGPCQGKTCISLVLRELSAKTNTPVNDLKAPKYRQPIKPIKIGAFLDE